MSHQHGAYLGSIRTIEDLRQRCVMSSDGDCWHLRTAHGRPLPRAQRHSIWIFGRGLLTATRGAWLLATGSLPQDQRGFVVFRSCESYDCVNPAHLKCGLRKTLIRHSVNAGTFETPARKAALKGFKASRPQAMVVTPELRVWLMESTQSGVEAAHGLGVTQGRANALRQAMRARPNSVFSMGNTQRPA